jgi:hypothetical protein
MSGDGNRGGTCRVRFFAWQIALLASLPLYLLHTSCQEVSLVVSQKSCGGRSFRLVNYSTIPLTSNLRLEYVLGESGTWKSIYSHRVQISPDTVSWGCIAPEKVCVYYSSPAESPYKSAIDLVTQRPVTTTGCDGLIRKSLSTSGRYSAEEIESILRRSIGLP